jgi:hypothetical protein
MTARADVGIPAGVEEVNAEYQIIEFKDAADFEEVLREHGLDFRGERCEDCGGATPYVFSSGSVVAEFGPQDPREGGYASYWKIHGYAESAVALWCDLLGRAKYIKREFSPLRCAETEEFVATARDVVAREPTEYDGEGDTEEGVVC